MSRGRLRLPASSHGARGRRRSTVRAASPGHGKCSSSLPFAHRIADKEIHRARSGNTCASAGNTRDIYMEPIDAGEGTGSVTVLPGQQSQREGIRTACLGRATPTLRLVQSLHVHLCRL